VIEYLAEKGYDSKMGARPLARKIDELVRVPLAKKVLFERINNANVMANLVDGEIQFNVSNKVSAVIGEDGIIQVEN
jgi:ATP-dependent Clp protease ATP-binding subunit ClpA